MNDSKVKGKWDEVAGKVKQGVGEAVGNDSMANRGTAQQVKGHAEQAWGEVKDAARDESARTSAEHDRRAPQRETTAHDVRESVASTAQNVKEHIKEGIADIKGDHYRKSA